MFLYIDIFLCFYIYIYIYIYIHPRYCIDQENIDASLMCLPVFLASCHTLLIIAGESYLDRLWRLEEVFVYLQLSRSRDTIEMLPICQRLG